MGVSDSVVVDESEEGFVNVLQGWGVVCGGSQGSGMGWQRRVLLSSAREMLGNEEARPAYSHGFLFAIDSDIDIGS
jgi:hypothetical protein